MPAVSGPIRVGVLDDLLDVASGLADWGRLPPHVSVTFLHERLEGEALVARLQPFDVLVAMRERTRLPRAVLERLPALRLLVSTGHRNPAIDLDACRQRGIVVCNTDSPGEATGELTWGLILAVARRIVEEDAALRAGRWQTGLGLTLNGRTLGLLGLGRIGTQVARIGLAFGMRVVAWSEHLTADRAAAAGGTLVSQETLFREADVLSIHLVLGDRTRGLVGERQLAWMRPGALLINTSRAAIVDEAALIDALQRGALGGAGLDVHAREPLPPDAPILRAPRTVLTPHVGYVTRDTYAVFFSQALENIEAWLAGAPVRQVVGPDAPQPSL